MAQASGADFVRAEGYVYSHVADEGWMDACAGELLRYRKAIGAEDILVFTDVKKKHRLCEFLVEELIVGINTEQLLLSMCPHSSLLCQAHPFISLNPQTPHPPASISIPPLSVDEQSCVCSHWLTLYCTLPHNLPYNHSYSTTL